MTQPLQATPLSLGTALHPETGSAVHAAPPLPPGRSIASLRAPRGTNFIRLAFAAVFLLGFLGLVGYLLKDNLPGLFPSLMGHDVAEEASNQTSSQPSIPSQASATPSTPLEKVTAEKSAPTTAESKPSPPPSR